MIFFPYMYEDELLYSVIARYHMRSGNISYNNTTSDIFGRNTVRSSIYLPSNISNMVKNLPINYLGDEMYIITNHTLFPFYTSFLSLDKSSKILHSMMEDSGVDIYSRVGLCASTIPMPEYLKFCPKCIEEDIEKYGETYWHRVHQIQCVEVCPKHKVILQDSTVKISSYNKQEYIAASTDNCILNETFNYSNDTIDKLYNLSKDIEYLLNSNFKRNDLEWYRDNYTNYLMERNLATPKGRIRQDKLVTEFKEFYGNEFLELVQSNINYEEKRNWVSEICRKTRYTIHPVRQLLFIRFLGIKIEDVFNNKYEYKPFGEGPWPCFNKASRHYGENVIQNVIIKYNYGTNRITGKFCCECGYKYSKEYSINDDNKKEKTKVLDFGEVWKGELINLVTQEQLTVQEIANRLGLDWNSTYKHIIKLGLRPTFKTSNKKLNAFENKHNIDCTFKDRKRDINEYRNKMLDILKQNSHRTRTEIKSLNRSLYVYLQKYDREWLEMNLPVKKSGKAKHSNVDWENRDEEILLKVQELVDKFMNTDEIPKRINLNRIGKTLNIYDILTKYQEKLPKTFEYLNDVIENRSDYIIRKIKWAIKKIDNEEQYLNVESVIQRAGIYGKDKINFKDFIDKEIIDYCERYKKVPFSN